MQLQQAQQQRTVGVANAVTRRCCHLTHAYCTCGQDRMYNKHESIITNDSDDV